MRRSRRLLVVLLAIAAGAAAIAQVPLRAASATKDAAVPVRVAVAMPAARAGEIRVTGTLHFKREISLAFKVQGYMAAFEVESGDTVKKGQILARIDSTEVRSRGSDAQAQLDNATAEFKRTQELFEKGFASQARVDAAKAALDRAGAARTTSKFDETKAVLVAPADGIILSRLAELNEVVAPGVPVILMGDAESGLILNTPLSDGQITRVREGDPAIITFAGLPPAKATVTRLAAKADVRTGAFDAELRLATIPEGVRSGLVGEARIQPSIKGQDALSLAIPAIALLEGRGDQAAVFVIDAAGTARRTSVRIAGFLDDLVLIASGLKQGDRVVTSGAPYLRNGQAVTIVSDKLAS